MFYSHGHLAMYKREARFSLCSTIASALSRCCHPFGSFVSLLLPSTEAPQLPSARLLSLSSSWQRGCAVASFCYPQALQVLSTFRWNSVGWSYGDWQTPNQLSRHLSVYSPPLPWASSVSQYTSCCPEVCEQSLSSVQGAILG